MVADQPLLCHRCGVEVHPGRGDFYVIRIEAFADPTGPEITDEDLKRDLRAEIDRLTEQLDALSEQEAMDQVYRRLVICLCTGCYRHWIENPAP